MNDERSEHLTRHAALCERYGKPEAVDAVRALELLGLTSRGPQDVIAFRYRDREAAAAFDASNAEHTPGYHSLGIADTDEGVIGILDLLPMTQALILLWHQVNEPPPKFAWLLTGV
jgi:hypothetical protein